MMHTSANQTITGLTDVELGGSRRTLPFLSVSEDSSTYILLSVTPLFTRCPGRFVPSHRLRFDYNSGVILQTDATSIQICHVARLKTIRWHIQN